jgi:hypothetical protein
VRSGNASTLIRRQCRFGHIVRSEFSFAGEVQKVGQLQASPVDPTFNSADRHVAHLSGFLVGQPLCSNEEKRLTLISRKRRQSRAKILEVVDGSADPGAS